MTEQLCSPSPARKTKLAANANFSQFLFMVCAYSGYNSFRGSVVIAGKIASRKRGGEVVAGDYVVSNDVLFIPDSVPANVTCLDSLGGWLYERERYAVPGTPGMSSKADGSSADMRAKNTTDNKRSRCLYMAGLEGNG